MLRSGRTTKGLNTCGASVPQAPSAEHSARFKVKKTVSTITTQ